jgi:citrate lyase beta subunit
VAALGATVVLDLEDALWDVTDDARTHQLKAQGRRNLVTLAEDHPDLFATQPVGVRLNRLVGAHATADLEALAQLSRRATLECVVAPKIEAAAEVAAWRSELDRANVRYRGIVPIVETVAGLANLADVLAGARRIGVDWVTYGLYDHALDAGWWPIPELDSERFWEVARPIIDEVEAAGMHYVQPPFFQLHRPERFSRIVARLNGACRRRPGAIALGLAQTALVMTHEAVDLDADAVATEHERRDPDATARHIVESYEANRRPAASFAVDGRSGEFISPHLYLAAQRYVTGSE